MVLIPSALGSNVTWKVVELPAVNNKFAGLVVTEKSEALFVEILGFPDNVKVVPPVFWIVNVFTTVPDAVSIEPKSLSLEVVVVVDPLTIETKFPCILISFSAEVPENLSSAWAPPQIVVAKAGLSINGFLFPWAVSKIVFLFVS